MNKNAEAIALTSRIAREIQQKSAILNKSVLFADDQNKLKTGFTIRLRCTDKQCNTENSIRNSNLGLEAQLKKIRRLETY